MIIVRFENILKSQEKTLRDICNHVELDSQKKMIPAAHQKVRFGSRFRDRWYPLNLDRALHYINKYNSSELKVVRTRCERIASELGYKSIYTF